MSKGHGSAVLRDEIPLEHRHNQLLEETHPMRKTALTVLGGVAALNGLLGYASQNLADMMNLRLQHYGAKVPALTLFALAVPPGFYVVGALALLTLGLGIRRIGSEDRMVWTAFALLTLDVAVLLLLLWGITHVAVRMR